LIPDLSQRTHLQIPVDELLADVDHLGMMEVQEVAVVAAILEVAHKHGNRTGATRFHGGSRKQSGQRKCGSASAMAMCNCNAQIRFASHIHVL